MDSSGLEPETSCRLAGAKHARYQLRHEPVECGCPLGLHKDYSISFGLKNLCQTLEETFELSTYVGICSSMDEVLLIPTHLSLVIGMNICYSTEVGKRNFFT